MSYLNTNFRYISAYSGDYNELLYLRARFYSPEVGRFLARDIWNGNANSPLSFNRWMYGYGNPVKYTDPSGHTSININYLTGNTSTKNYLTDTQETYFTRNLASSDKDADAYTTVAGPNAPVTILDYILAAIDCGAYLEQFEWWMRFTRWGAGYGPDAKSVVYYYPAATGIRSDDLKGLVVSHVAIYAYTYVDNVFISTKVSDKYGLVVYNKLSQSIPELLMSNIYGSSHLYNYTPQIFVPETKNGYGYKIIIEVQFSARRRNFTGKTVHEIDT